MTHFRKTRSILWLLFSFSLLFLCMPLIAQEQKIQPAAVAMEAGSEECSQQLRELVKEENAKTRRKVAALQKELIQVKMDMEKPGLTDIIGGIGYIVGIFGLAFYLAARKKSRQTGKHSE